MDELAMYLTVGFSVAVVLGLLIWFLVWLRGMLWPYLTSHTRSPHTWTVRKGRRAALGHSGMVVFVIGMRINRWYRIDLWLPTLTAMSKMLKELHENDHHHGYYGGESYGMFCLFFGYPSLQITYWESVEKVHAFSTGKTHKTSMRKFMEAMKRAKGAVGVYHELYKVEQFEGMHRDMPDFGLVRAVGSRDASGNRLTSAGRLHSTPIALSDVNKSMHNKVPVPVSRSSGGLPDACPGTLGLSESDSADLTKCPFASGGAATAAV